MKKALSFVLFSGIMLTVSSSLFVPEVSASNIGESTNVLSILPEDQDGIVTLPDVQSRAVTQAYVTDIIKYYQSYPPAKVPHAQMVGGTYLSGTVTRTSVRMVEGGYAATYAGWLYK